MDVDSFAAAQAELFAECRSHLSHGQREYARDGGTNAFANFERVAKLLHLDREVVLMVYLLKHIDGVIAHVAEGHTSQREPVTGRIIDAINYLTLLHGMETESRVTESRPSDSRAPDTAARSGNSLTLPGVR